jgi:LCP family protein required for cell wall assembly
MADRRNPAGGPGGGQGNSGDETASYDWLYGDSKSQPDPSASESTQVIPTGGRPAAGSGGSGGGDAPPRHIAPTPSGPPPSARGTSRRPRFRARWLLYLLIAWLVFLIAVPIYAWSTVDDVKADPAGKRPADQPGTTYLVVGSDARKGLAGQRTDTLMLLHTGKGPSLLMSIPRDSLVEVPGHGVTKINAAFAYGGPRLLVNTVEQSTGIRVDHYVEIGFTGFVKLVDAVGGITICPKTAMKDSLAHINIKAGCQNADGKTALGYARSRHTQALGDIGRAQHQREVVGAIGKEVLSWKTLVNPVRYWKVMTGGAQSVRVSDGTGPIDAGKFAFAMTRVDGKHGLTCAVPISDLAVHWDTARANQLFKLIAEDRTSDVGHSLCEPTGMAAP